MTIVLKAALPLAGVVVGADGTPVAHAVLRADGRDARGFSETDAEGRFTLAAFGPGRIAVFADGGERGVREVTGIVLPRREERAAASRARAAARPLTGASSTSRRASRWPARSSTCRAPGARGPARAPTGPSRSDPPRPATFASR